MKLTWFRLHVASVTSVDGMDPTKLPVDMISEEGDERIIRLVTCDDFAQRSETPRNPPRGQVTVL